MRIVWLKRGAVFNERGYSTPREPGDEDDVTAGFGACMIAVQKAKRAPHRGPAPVAKVLHVVEEE